MSDLVKRLRNTPNWKRESYGSWKDCVLTCDRAPFEAADELERLTRELEEARKEAERLDWLNTHRGRMFILIQSILFSSKESWRAAIDNAMSQEK